MPQPMGFNVRLGWSGWLTLLIALALVLLVAAVLAIVLLGVFIFLLPAVLVSALIYYLFPSMRNRQQGRWSEPDVIEGQYRVVDPRRPERELLPPDRP